MSGSTFDDRAHAERVLRGDRGNRGRRVNPEGVHRAHVGLDARATAGVRSGDGQSGDRLHLQP